MIPRSIVKLIVMFLMVAMAGVGTAQQQQIKIAYFSQEQVAPPALSNLDPFIKNKGIPGAELGVADNNATGQFTGQTYQLEMIVVEPAGDVAKQFQDKIVSKY
ncbi:MAG: branched-chain amino acid ABC transporter substrate-binding protein, partial [Gammaproteobacteria bacterium]